MKNSFITEKNLPLIAEICGIHAGDGYLRNDGQRREWDISGNIEEKEYYDNFVVPLFNKLFGLSIAARYFPSRRTYGFRTYNKKVVELLIYLGFPSGKKTTIVSVPEIILKSNNKIICSFLRGYFDTDGYFGCMKRTKGKYTEFKLNHHYYPQIMFTCCSKNLAIKVKELTNQLGINCKLYIYKPKKQTENLKYKLQITGKESCNLWMNLIGSKNSIKLSRYRLFKKYGFCPTNTTYSQRNEVLCGKLKINQLFKA